MPEAYGNDRVRIKEDGNVVLLSPYPKGWTPHVERTLSAPPSPGTMILWGEEVYEVEKILPAGNGVRYELRRWPEEHAVRFSDKYDPESEARRLKERVAATSRRNVAFVSQLLMFLTGHLPRHVQEEMASELGISASFQTGISTIPFLGYGLLCVVFLNAAAFGAAPPFPPWAMALGLFFFFESVARIASAVFLLRPLGSVAGVIVYNLYALARGKRYAAPPVRGEGLIELSYEDRHGEEGGREAELRDGFKLREPLFSVVDEQLQLFVKQRFGFDPIASGKKSAAVLLLIGVVQVVSTAMRFSQGEAAIGHGLSGLAGLLLAIEQIARFVKLQNGRPAASVLRIVAEPMVRAFVGKAGFERRS